MDNRVKNVFYQETEMPLDIIEIIFSFVKCSCCNSIYNEVCIYCGNCFCTNCYSPWMTLCVCYDCSHLLM